MCEVAAVDHLKQQVVSRPGQTEGKSENSSRSPLPGRFSEGGACWHHCRAAVTLRVCIEQSGQSREGIPKSSAQHTTIPTQEQMPDAQQIHCADITKPMAPAPEIKGVATTCRSKRDRSICNFKGTASIFPTAIRRRGNGCNFGPFLTISGGMLISTSLS